VEDDMALETRAAGVVGSSCWASLDVRGCRHDLDPDLVLALNRSQGTYPFSRGWV
jgi:hypothetical protein